MPELLRGQLGPIGLSSLLQLASTEGVSGTLSLGPSASVGLYEGAVVSARHGGARGLEALRMTFLLQVGVFVLTDDAPAERKSFGNSTGLILDGLRFSDEWAEHAALVLAVDPAVSWRPADTAAAEVIGLLQGQLTLAEVISISGHSPARVLDSLREGLRVGALYEAAPPDPKRVSFEDKPPTEEEYFNLVDEGRTSLRAGELSRAEVAFRRALRARPEDGVARQNLRRVLELRRTQTH